MEEEEIGFGMEDIDKSWFWVDFLGHQLMEEIKNSIPREDQLIEAIKNSIPTQPLQLDLLIKSTSFNSN